MARPRLKLDAPLWKEARRPRKPGHRATPLEKLRLRPMESPDGLRGVMAAHLEAMAVENHSESSRLSRAVDLRNFAEWCEARSLSRPGEVTRPLIERYQRHLYNHRKKNGAPLTVERQYCSLSHLKSFFRWATKQNLVLANPAADITMPKLPTRLPRHTLTVADVEKVVARCDVTTLIGLRDRVVIEVFWATGIRRAELCGLSLWDVQWEKQTLFIRLGKGQKDRVVPISQRALHWVRRYVEEVRPRYAASPDDGRLFLSETGKGFTTGALTQIVGALVRSVGLKAKGACHLFRHSCATAMLEGGADVRYVQELLGHAKLNTTQIYTHVSITKLKEVYEATHPGARAGGENRSGKESPVAAGEEPSRVGAGE